MADTEQAVARSSNRAHQTVDKLTASVQPAVDRLAAGAHQAVDKLATTAGRLGERADDLNASRQRLTLSSHQYVRDNPLAPLGIAALAGFLLSRLINSRG